MCSMTLSNGNSFSEGNPYGGEGTERECPFIARLLRPCEDRR